MFEFEVIQEIKANDEIQAKLWRWIQHSKIELRYIFSIV